VTTAANWDDDPFALVGDPVPDVSIEEIEGLPEADLSTIQTWLNLNSSDPLRASVDAIIATRIRPTRSMRVSPLPPASGNVRNALLSPRPDATVDRYGALLAVPAARSAGQSNSHHHLLDLDTGRYIAALSDGTLVCNPMDLDWVANEMAENPPEPIKPADHPWIARLLASHDIAWRHPGNGARDIAQALSRLGEQPVAALWAIGAVGEDRIGATLNQLPPDWIVLHDVTVGDQGANVDHLVIGPRGIFVLDTKHHPAAHVFAAGRTVTVTPNRVGGSAQRRKYEHAKAARVATAHVRRRLIDVTDLSRRLANLPIHPVLVITGHATLKYGEIPPDVPTIEDRHLIAWLLNHTPDPPLRPADLAALATAVRNPANWPTAPAADQVAADIVHRIASERTHSKASPTGASSPMRSSTGRPTEPPTWHAPGLPPAGWYPEPDDHTARLVRYWTGHIWTDRVRYWDGEAWRERGTRTTPATRRPQPARSRPTTEPVPYPNGHQDPAVTKPEGVSSRFATALGFYALSVAAFIVNLVTATTPDAVQITALSSVTWLTANLAAAINLGIAARQHSRTQAWGWGYGLAAFTCPIIGTGIVLLLYRAKHRR
jgi:hypothetical protein